MEFWEERKEVWGREFVGSVTGEVKKKKKMKKERERRTVNVRNRDFAVFVAVLPLIAIFIGLSCFAL